MSTEAQKKASRDWYYANKEHVLTQRKARYDAGLIPKRDLKKKSEYAKRWNEKNPEKVCEQQKRKRQRNRSRLEGRAAKLLSGARQRAKLRGFDFDLDLQWFMLLWEKQKRCCPVFGGTLNIEVMQRDPAAPSLDRKDNSKGYTKENTWIISYRANRLKSDASLLELQMLVHALEGSF